ncbi:MAG: MBL fold metallo-hydrolase [Syntrophomonadaceae bacterium]|nr:MBL fold metallo-hydrolase [Syntrophomonadaceae bacterium]
MLKRLDGRLAQVVSEAGFTYCNCLYIDDDVKTLIETGASDNSWSEIDADSIDRILYTHHHIDHIRGNDRFKKAVTSIHPLDALALDNFPNFLHYNSIDQWNELMPDNVYANVTEMNLAPDSFEKMIKVNGTFEDGEIIDLGATRLQVVHTPGHSAGHCVFWFPDQEFLFSGDICLTKAGPWYSELYADPGQMIDSINKVIELKPKSVLSSHITKLVIDPMPCLKEYRDRILKRDDNIYNFLKQQKKPETIHDMAGRRLIYKIYPTMWVIFWEKLMLIKHLERLKQVGLVEEVEKDSFIAC